MKLTSIRLLAATMLATLPFTARAASEGNIVIASGALKDQYGNYPKYQIPAGTTLTVLNFTQETASSPQSILTVQRYDSAFQTYGITVFALYASVVNGVSDANQVPAPALAIPGPAQIIVTASTGGTTNLLFSASASPSVFSSTVSPSVNSTPFTVPAGYRLDVLNFIQQFNVASSRSSLMVQQLDGSGAPIGPANSIAVAVYSNIPAASQNARTPKAGGQATVVGPAQVTIVGGASGPTYAAFNFTPNK